MIKISKIEAELVKATILRSRPREKREKFLDRLARAAAELADDDWSQLSESAQSWAAAAGEAINSDNAVQDFEEFFSSQAAAEEEIEEDADEEETEEDADEEETEEDADDEEEETPAPKKATKKKAVSKPAAKETRKPKRGGTALYRRLMIEHPEWSQDQLLAAVEKEGFTMAPSTASIVYYETRGTLAVLSELGYDVPQPGAARKAAKAPEEPEEAEAEEEAEEEAPAPKKPAAKKKVRRKTA